MLIRRQCLTESLKMNEKNTIECLDLYQGRGQDEMSQGMEFYNTDLISCKYNNLNVLDSAKNFVVQTSWMIPVWINSFMWSAVKELNNFRHYVRSLVNMQSTPGKTRNCANISRFFSVCNSSKTRMSQPTQPPLDRQIAHPRQCVELTYAYMKFVQIIYFGIRLIWKTDKIVISISK